MKHRRHGMNVQVIAAPDGIRLWFSRALPGRIHDLTAARAHGIVQACLSRQLLVLADKAYQGASTTVRTAYNAMGVICPNTTGSSTRTTPAYASPANELSPG